MSPLVPMPTRVSDALAALTPRDLFAIGALIALAHDSRVVPAAMAQRAYKIADAMLEAREQ